MFYDLAIGIYDLLVHLAAPFSRKPRKMMKGHWVFSARRRPPGAPAARRPGQKDQDSLPDYDTLDAILKLYLEENSSKQEIIAKGFAPEIVEKTITLVNRNDYKRAQCPPILKVSKKEFGSGRRMPLVAKL